MTTLVRRSLVWLRYIENGLLTALVLLLVVLLIATGFLPLAKAARMQKIDRIHDAARSCSTLVVVHALIIFSGIVAQHANRHDSSKVARVPIRPVRRDATTVVIG